MFKRLGVFYLFGQGRLRLSLSQPSLALESYQKAMDVQDQYRNLHYISLWEMAICNYALWDIPGSLKCWRVLEDEATWSRACYAYGMAVCLLELGGSDNITQACKLMEKIPRVLHKIAGKSIPIEVCIFEHSLFTEALNMLCRNLWLVKRGNSKLKGNGCYFPLLNLDTCSSQSITHLLLCYPLLFYHW